MSFKVTREWIQAFKTGSGGWRRAQLAAIGIAWPPEHGWIERVIGLYISDEQRQAFQAEGPLPQLPIVVEQEDLDCAKRIKKMPTLK